MDAAMNAASHGLDGTLYFGRRWPVLERAAGSPAAALDPLISPSSNKKKKRAGIFFNGKRYIGVFTGCHILAFTRR